MSAEKTLYDSLVSLQPSISDHPVISARLKARIDSLSTALPYYEWRHQLSVVAKDLNCDINDLGNEQCKGTEVCGCVCCQVAYMKKKGLSAAQIRLILGVPELPVAE